MNATILDEIIADTLLKVKNRKGQISLGTLKEMSHFNRTCISLKEILKNNDQPKIIAEIKKASPSKGLFKEDLDLSSIIEGYSNAAAISVLTNEKYFQGS